MGVRSLPRTEQGRMFGSYRTLKGRNRMPAIRTSQRDQLAIAIEDLAEVAGLTTGLSISVVGPDRVRIEMDAWGPWLAAVHPRSSLSPQEAEALIAAEADGSAHIVVADQIAAKAKEQLVAASWSWLDRRSELRLLHRYATIEIRLPPGGLHPEPSPRMALAAPASDSPIRGRAGISYAAALLVSGEAKPSSIRSVARAIGMAPSTVSEAAALLRASGYILPNGEPEVPDLFDALVAVWRPVHAKPVATRPVPDELEWLKPNVDDLDEIGWAQGGDEAALAWGAPMFLSGDRPWIWVPDLLSARRAERRLGSADWANATGVIAVPPTPLVCIGRRRAPLNTIDWPTPHPLYLALDLARDQGRGREILDGWKPPEPLPYPWTRESDWP